MMVDVSLTVMVKKNVIASAMTVTMRLLTSAFVKIVTADVPMC